MRKIVHIDMDAFYASIEQKDNPHFRGKPLIVGGDPNGRGVVAACSYEARAFGIHSAMACSRAVRLCPKASFTRPRIQRYREISTTIMEIFRQYTPLVEPLSLDEAFLDVTVNSVKEYSATLLAERIRQKIHDETGLTASAGISYNKFLAKVASDVNKPDGTTTIPPAQAQSFLAALPIGKFFGVGKVTEEKMHKLGIRTGADLLTRKREEMRFHFGKNGSFFYNIVRGIDERPVQPHRVRKSVGTEITLHKDTNDLIEIRAILRNLAEKIESALLNKGIGGQTLTLKVRYHDFSTITRSRTWKYPLQTADEIQLFLPGLLSSTRVGKKEIRLLGLSLSKLTKTKAYPRQLLLPYLFAQSAVVENSQEE